jgi:phosphatidate cytidylyltransferase
MTDAPRSKRMSNLLARVLTAAVAVPLLLYLLFVAPEWIFVMVLGVASLVGAAELFAMTLPGRRLLQAVGGAATAAVFVAVASSDISFKGDRVAATAVGVILLGMIASLVRPEPLKEAAARVGWVVAGPFYVGALIGTMALLFRGEQGGQWVALAMTISWFGDTGAYFTGRAIGRRKLAPLVSPGKTVEGALGGLLGSVLAALLAHEWYLRSLPLADGVALALGAGALGQAGDLCESLIKRSSGVKESGFILPGHGGLLDRIDALLFVSAATWVYAEFFYA